jgi:exonuclease SbcC
VTPLSIEIEGIRSFTTRRIIDFGGLELFAIIGDTGSGKSSILEAMIYGLFNGTTWDGKNVKELMSTSVTRMRVVFRFALAGKTYSITRITPRIGAASHLLECDGHAEERRDGERPIAVRLKELLGVDREQFIKTVVLPQGEFAALLTLNPGLRAQLLTDVLGLGIIDVMAQRLGNVRARANTLYDTMKGRRAAFPDDPAGALGAATELEERRTRGELVLQQALNDIGLDETMLAELRQREESRATTIATINLIAPEVEGLRSLREVDDELQKKIESSESEEVEAKTHLARAVAEIERARTGGVDSDTVSTHQRTLLRLEGESRERDREAAELEACKAQVTSIESAVAEQLSVATAAAARADQASLEESAAKKDSEAASAALQAAEKVLNAFVLARTAFAEATEAQRVAGASLSSATTEADRAKRGDAEAQQFLDSARARLSVSERENAAAHAAHDLVPGDACPICFRALPPEFHAPLAADLDRAKRDFDAAEAGRLEAARVQTQATTRLQFAQSTLEKTKAEVERSQFVFEEAMAHAEAAGLDVAAESSDALAGVRDQAGSAESRRAAASGAFLAADREHIEAELALKTARERLTEAQADVTRRLESLGRRDRDIAALRSLIPTSYLPESAKLSESVLATAAARLGAAADAARELAAAHVNALEAERDATERSSALHERRRLEIERPITERRQRLVLASDALLAAGYAMPPEWPDSNRRLSQVVEWGEGLVKSSAEVAAHLGMERAKDANASETVNAKIAERLLSCGVTSLAELREKREVALLELGAAISCRERLARNLQEASALDGWLTQIEPLARALGALHTCLGGAKFRKFVTERKQDKLLGVATSILRRMTNERYGFGADMRIVDRASSQTRSPETLSGGEKFLASLALALGLVEIAKRSGRHFGALFLDEGFGSLDPQALDEALSELERQAESGRMIGVITHVPSVVEYIDDVLLVVRTPSGSEVNRLGADELERLTLTRLAPA